MIIGQHGQSPPRFAMNPPRLTFARTPGSLLWPGLDSTRGSGRLAQAGRQQLTATATRGPVVALLPGREPWHAREARRRTRVLLEEWGVGDQASLGELVLGELVANAVRHGDMPIWIRLSVAGGLRIEVHDGGAGRPMLRHAGESDESGRGLELLDGLIEPHGGERGVVSDLVGPGKTVFVLLPREITKAGDR